MTGKDTDVVPQPRREQVPPQSRPPAVLAVMAVEGAALAVLAGLDGSALWQVVRVLVILAVTAGAVWFTGRAGRAGRGTTALLFGIVGTMNALATRKPQSVRFTVVACTLTRTSWPVTAGLATSATRTTSGGPYRVCTAAFTGDPQRQHYGQPDRCPPPPGQRRTCHPQRAEAGVAGRRAVPGGMGNTRRYRSVPCPPPCPGPHARARAESPPARGDVWACSRWSARQALRQQLGSSYKVTRHSESSRDKLTVSHRGRAFASVHLARNGNATTFHMPVTWPMQAPATSPRQPR